MPKYIAKGKAKEAVDYAIELSKSEYDIMCAAINQIPAADVAPVVRGRWVESRNFDAGFWTCSNCRFVSEATAAHKLYNYCPNCGAKMDLRED